MSLKCDNCKHPFNQHAPAYDDYDFERYCYECDCLGWEGDIEEAYEEEDLDKAMVEGYM